MQLPQALQDRLYTLLRPSAIRASRAAAAAGSIGGLRGRRELLLPAALREPSFSFGSSGGGGCGRMGRWEGKVGVEVL